MVDAGEKFLTEEAGRRGLTLLLLSIFKNNFELEFLVENR